MTDTRGPVAGPTEDRFFDLSIDLLCIAGMDGYFKRLNPAWEKTLGFSIAELMARPSNEFIHPDDRGRSSQLGEALREGRDVVRFENRLLCKDGSYRWISWKCTAVPDGAGLIYAIGRDVSEARRAREALDQKTAELEAVFSALPDLLFRTDANGRLVGYNAGRASDLYATPESFLGKTFVDVLPPDVGAAISQTIERAQRQASIESVEYALRVPSGDQWFEARCVPLAEGHTVTVVRNVTERLRAQEELERSNARLRESEKVEAIGRLAGGIAHDFNNLMMSVMTYADVLLRRLPPDDPQGRELREIRAAGERAARLTKQLLAFARRQFLSPTVLDPFGIVRDMQHMLRDVIGEHIDLETSCADEPWNVRVDRGQLEQVVLNLALNARDAMPSGGKLTIRVENAVLDESESERLGLPKPGQFVRLAVIDTGCGISPGALPHIFEPFFTTKQHGSGTGLGLATVYGVVGQSGGSISVDTAPGKGATFSIFLPRAFGDAEPARVAERSELRRGDETVLVVEDEAAVLRAIGDTLRPLGYRVLEAANGEDALRIGETHAGVVHLLLTDVVMPGIGGQALAERLVEIRPDVRVIYMSGYAADAADATRFADAGAVLEKPFDPETLAHRIREVLDAAAAPRRG